MTPCEKFKHEAALVTHLFVRLGLEVPDLINPNKGGSAQDESGADVIAVSGNARIGIQVTDLDTGDKPGDSRRNERKTLADCSRKGFGTYGGFAQNNRQKIVAATERAIQGKTQTIAGCTETWLLISANIPEQGTTISTFVPTQWLSVADLELTLPALSNCNYDHVYLHPIISTEGALYHWKPGQAWEKIILPASPTNNPSPFTLQDANSEWKEWLLDRDEKAERVIEETLGLNLPSGWIKSPKF